MNKTTASLEIQKLRRDVYDLQSDIESTSSSLLDRTNVKSVEDIDTIITSAVVLLNQMSGKKDGKVTGTIKSLFSKLPGFSKISTKIEETIVENMTMKEAVDKMYNTIQNSIDTMMSDLDDLNNIHDSIHLSVENAKAKLSIIEDAEIKAKEEERRVDLSHIRKLKIQLKAIIISNQESLNGLGMQLSSSEATSDILSQILPVLKPTLYQQAGIAVANINNERVRKTLNITTEVLNEIMISNKESTHKTITETIKLSNKKLITKETLQRFEQLNAKFAIELKATAMEQRQQTLEYEQVVMNNQKLLAENKVSLLEDLNEDE